jgi:hypothetical protein
VHRRGYQRQRRRSLHTHAGDESGPGGACVVSGPAGDQWLVYHAWTRGAIGYPTGGSRSLRFASVSWHDRQPVVLR